MALLSFFFLELEKWFQTSSYSFLPSLENSDHTTKSTDTWMNWTACQCYSRKKRGGEFINCTTEYEFIYKEKNAHLIEWKQYERKTPLQWHIILVFKQSSVQDIFFKYKKEVNLIQLLKQRFWNRKYQTSTFFLQNLYVFSLW